MLYAVADLLETTPTFPIIDEEEESVVYRYQEEDNEIHVRNLGNSQWRLSGYRIEHLFRKTKFENEDDVFRFANTLRKMGVDQMLREAGALDGDEVFILDYSFEFVESYD